MDINKLTAKTCFLLATYGLLRLDGLACTSPSAKSTETCWSLKLYSPWNTEEAKRSSSSRSSSRHSQSSPFLGQDLSRVSTPHFETGSLRQNDTSQVRDRALHSPHPTYEASQFGLKNDRISNYIQEIMQMMLRDKKSAIVQGPSSGHYRRAGEGYPIGRRFNIRQLVVPSPCRSVLQDLAFPAEQLHHRHSFLILDSQIKSSTRKNNGQRCRMK